MSESACSPVWTKVWIRHVSLKYNTWYTLLLRKAKTEYQHHPASEVCDTDVTKALLCPWGKTMNTDRNNLSLFLRQEETEFLLHEMSRGGHTYQSVTQSKVETILVSKNLSCPR